MSNQATVFISHLPPNTKEADIRNCFTQFGRITDIQFNQRNQSVKVTFSSHEEAQRAINDKKNINIRGESVRVTWNHGSLIISNLPPHINDDELKKKLTEVKIPFVDVQLRPPQQALVTFENQSIASEYMSKLNGININGSRIAATVFHSQPRPQYANLPNFITFIEGEEKPELPQNAYATLKVNGGYAIFYPPNMAPQPQANETPQNQNSDNKNANPTRVRADVYNDIFRFLEEMTVYVEGFKQETTQDEISSFFSQAGQIISLQKHSPREEIIQYATVEARNKALKLSKSTLPNQKNPLAVLPFINKLIPHKDSGLLQINELPPTMSVEKLTEEFKDFGNILAVSISPTGFDEPPYGFILYQLFDQAKSAKQAKTSEKYPNIFLYPPLRAHESIFAFTESQNSPNNCLVIYDLPMKTLEPEINQLCKDFGYIKSSFVLTDGASKAAYVYYSTPSNAIDAFYQLSSEKRHVDILNGNALSISSQLLRDITLPAEWKNLLLFVMGLPIDFGTSKLRSELMAINLNFDSCFVNILPTTGTSKQTGIILVRDRGQALWLTQNMNSVIKSVNASLFRSKGGYAANADPIASQTSPYKFPVQQQRRPPLSPREWLKQFIELNYSSEIQSILVPKLQQLSIFETQNYAMNFPLFLYWIQSNAPK